MREIKLMLTGISGLDALLGGGIPTYSLNIIAGQPGTGKTILVQQMLFNYIRHHNKAKALYLTTLSEPTLKVVRYMQCFTFFDGDLFGEQVIYQDIAPFIRQHSLDELADYIIGLVEKHQPEVLAIDSFKAIRDLSTAVTEFRRFCYDLSVRLASARCTTFLLGEYDRSEIGEGSEFAVADGILYLNMALQEGRQQRFLQIYKLRGQATEMIPFPFIITQQGTQVLGSMLILGRQQVTETEIEPALIGISGLDAILQGGIPRGRSVLLSGVSGTGKTTLALQFLVNGALQGEKGILFSFEETPARLRQTAEGFGWNLAGLEEKGLIRIIFIPQTDIRVEEQLEQMARECEDFRPSRYVVDSFSVFLHKVSDVGIQREKTFQLSTLMQHVGAVGILISNIPAGEVNRLSRFGVEETVVDGLIVLSTEAIGLQRKRYLEVYKMRAVNYVSGRHRMEITQQGVEVLYLTPQKQPTGPVVIPSLIFSPLHALVPEGVRYGSAWLVRGEQGVGKTTIAQQFAVEGLQRGESALYIATEVSSYLVNLQMQIFGVDVDAYSQSQQFHVLDAYSVSSQDYIDLSDMERFFYDVERYLRRMPKPCRIITDSLTPLAIQYQPEQFIAFIERKNRLLRQPDVALFDTVLPKTLNESVLYSLLNSYDAVLDIHTPDWGEMNQVGQGFRVIQMRKARGTQVDTRPYPYTIRPGKGVVVQESFYGER